MPDFNNKKEILRRLRAKKNTNKALWLPCSVAELCVKAWYAAVCRLGLIFSDRNGRFLGVGHTSDKPKPRRTDDIVYVKKPFFGRLLSVALAAAFVMMFVPDLGISFDAAAADPIDLGVPVIDENGNKINVMIVSNYNEMPTYFIDSGEYNAVVKNAEYKATNIDYSAGYGAVRVTWDKPAMNPQSSIRLEGYDIKLYQNGRQVGNPVSVGPEEFEAVFDGLTTNFNTYAIVIPKFSMRKLVYMGALDPDALPATITVSYVDDSDRYMRSGAECGGSSVSVTPDARFEKPVFTIRDNDDKEIYSCTSAEQIGGGVNLVWNPSAQKGGQKKGGQVGDGSSQQYATGYVIYRYNVTKGDIVQTVYIPDDPKASKIIYPYKEKLDSGTRYQFFIEAFRYAWSDSSGFDSTQKDIISSSEGKVGADNKEKLSLYSKVTKDLYVAPSAPSLSVTPDPKTKSFIIDLVDDSRKNYDGVEIYRSIGRINPISIDEIMNGEITFTEWLREHADADDEYYDKFKLTYIRNVSKGEKIPPDNKDIAESTEYYYYAIAYTNVASTTQPIYSDPSNPVSAIMEVMLNKPNLSADNGDGKVTLTWDPLIGGNGYQAADGYKLEITQTKKYDPTLKKPVDVLKPVTETVECGNDTKYVHENLYNGEKYTYRLLPYIMIETKDGKKPYYGEPSKTITITVGKQLDTPSIEANGETDGQVTIKWEPVTGATGYTLFSIDQNTGKKEQFDVRGTSYTHKGLINDHIMEYYIKAYKEINADYGEEKQVEESKESAHITVKVGTALTTPQDLKTVTTDGTITVSWAAVPGAKGYLLHYKCTKKDGTAYDYSDETVFNVIKPSYVHSGLNNGDRYTYYVEAYKEVSGKKVYSPKSNEAWAIVGIPLDAPKDLLGTAADGKIDLKWSASKGAEGYILHIMQDGIEIEKIDISKTGYSHLNLKNGDTYSYTVTAYKTVNGERVSSPDSNTITLTVGVPLNAPMDFTGEAGDGEVELEWTAVRGAAGYTLYYRRNGGAWQSIDLSRPGYEHIGLNNGDRYDYYVTAYKDVNGERVPSAQSNTLSFTIGVPMTEPIDFSGTAADGKVTLKWTAVRGANGYTLYFRRNGGAWQSVDLSKPGFEHIGLNNGDTYDYYVVAYKDVNGKRVHSSQSNILSFTIGDFLEMPRDFNAVTIDGQVTLTWTAVKGAQGYVVYAYGGGRSYQFDVTKNSYVHNNLDNGDSWTYYVVAYKTVNGIRVYSSPTKSITVSVGVSLNAVIDLVATAGNRQVDLSWSAVKGAEGYVVYLYNTKTMEFEPITVISNTKYSHTGLKNGTKYTYMVAPYKTIGGTRYYGEYSLSVTATPSLGSNTDIDNELTVKGTTPYGISHSEYIDASANHGAFDEPVDVYFTTNKESTDAVKDVLKNYADGLKSFIIYPFDISVYKEGTREKVSPNNGYSVTITMPIPDRLIAYRDYITVVHIGDGLEDLDDTTEITMDDAAEDWVRNDDGRLEVLPCAIVDIDNVWCVQFVCTSFSPYALVIYKEHLTDVSASGGVIDGSFAGTFNSGVLLFTALPDIMPNNKRLKVVRGGKKRYYIKSIEKIR